MQGKTVATGGTNGSLMFNINEYGIKDGVIFSDENITVTALHNLHLGEKNEIKGWLSYSFLIEIGNMKIVYSGDVKKINELDALIGDGTDFLIMETGHHKVIDVLNYALSKKVKNLRFNHHGREIINDRSGCENTISKFSAHNEFSAKICFDNMIEEI